MTDSVKHFDVIIVGGGPAGTTAALYAQRQGLSAILLEKEKFPRDKICGEALSGKTVTLLRELGLHDEVAQLPGIIINRILFGSPDHTNLIIDLRNSALNQIPDGFVIRRTIFDHFMFRKAQAAIDECHDGFAVTDILVEDGKVYGVRGHGEGSQTEIEYRANLVIGADGYKSIVLRKLGHYKHEADHICVALRQYHRNVGGLTDQIELHYVDEVIPGYFWIFPLEDGYANVGIGMLHRHMKDYKVDLKAALQAAIDSPAFRGRFAEAEVLEEPVGWNLPIGSKRRVMSGDGFMLLGDAAGLVDPFTGEGIGNAFFSAKYAMEAARLAKESGDYSAAFLKKNYDKVVWDTVGPELRLSRRLQKIGQYRFLLNFVIRKAAGNKELANLIAGMIANEVPKEKLTNPFFYLKLLFS